MKKKDVKIGKVYLVTVTGKRARVRLTGKNANGGWDGLNLDTKRKVRVKTAGRLEREIADPEAPEKVAPKRVQGAPTPPQEQPAGKEARAQAGATSGDEAAQETPLTKLTIEELRQRYFEIIGRDTSSTNKAYLVWKLREAAKGRISIGPRATRAAADFKVLPLRMDAELVTQLDEARERLGLPSRMDLLRRAIHTYLDSQGEAEVAALFATDA